MEKHLNIRTLLLIVYFLSVAYGMASLAQGKLRVLDQGMDGNQRVYLVTCPDGGLASVAQTFSLPTRNPDRRPDHSLRLAHGNSATPPQLTRVCAYPVEGQDRCQGSWDVDAAAEYSCQ